MTRSYRALGLAFIAMLALAVSSTAATAKTKSAVGTLQKVDGDTLTIQTSKGHETVRLGPAAQIHSHATPIPVADLPSHVGDKVKVHYTENNGQKQASAVTLSPATEKKASTATHAPKKGEKS